MASNMVKLERYRAEVVQRPTELSKKPTCWPKLGAKDAVKFLVCNTHIGTSDADFQSQHYVYKRARDGVHLVNLGYTWFKLGLAARAFAAISDPAEVCVVSSRPQVQRAILKFAAHTGATPIVGRFVPGSFTNQKQKKNFKEPRLIIISDPRADHQAVTEASYVNVPVISFTNVDSPLKHIDIAIPCNNKGIESVGLMWWMLAREILKLKEDVFVEHTFFMVGDRMVMPDLYFYRDPEEQKKEEEAEKEAEQVKAEQAKAEQQKAEEGKIEFEQVELDEWAVFDPE